MYSVINAFDPKEIISVTVGGGDGSGFWEMKAKMRSILEVDVAERNASPLDDSVAEPIVRHFGFVIAEHYFSPAGPLQYVHAHVDGEHTDYDDSKKMSAEPAKLIDKAAARRDKLTEERRKKRELTG
jgi:hypothetical protein